jgi:hypothetical protein
MLLIQRIISWLVIVMGIWWIGYCFVRGIEKATRHDGSPCGTCGRHHPDWRCEDLPGEHTTG